MISCKMPFVLLLISDSNFIINCRCDETQLVTVTNDSYNIITLQICKDKLLGVKWTNEYKRCGSVETRVNWSLILLKG